MGFLCSEEAKDLLGDEVKTVEAMVEQEEKDKTTVDSVKTVAKDLAKKIHDAKKHEGKGKGGRGRGAAAGPPPFKKARKYPAAVEFTSGLNVGYLNTFVPEGCRFGIDLLDRLWRLSAYGRVYGRSWGLHSEVGAAKLLISLAWKLAIENGHEVECHFAEIEL